MTLVLVTGGTGRAGHLVAPRLRDAGCQVRVLSRKSHQNSDGIEFATGDLATGQGIDEAVRGAEVIVHCAASTSFRRFRAMAPNLVRAAQRSGTTPHLVGVSVVGADRIPVTSPADRAMFGYFSVMRASEQAVENSGLPWTMLRATQFHDALIIVARAMTKLPVVPVAAGFRFQPVDTGEVADRLAELALGTPAGLVPDFAGPVAYPMGDLLRGYLRAVGKHRVLVPVRLPGKAARAVRAGANLPADGTLGRRTWENFLGTITRNDDGSLPTATA
jgi:uncharacterized protein YbjT (DUF2867 family)